MIHSSAEARAARVYLLLLPGFTILLILIHLLCGLLPSPWALISVWLCNVALAVLLPWLVNRLVLSSFPAAPQQIVIDGRLLLDRGFAVHHVLCPLDPSTQARLTSGSSMLLLSTAAMLTLPQEAQSPEHRAILRFLKPLAINQGDVLLHYPKARTCDDRGLHWSIHRDGSDLRAYACGSAADVLAACTYIWDNGERPLTDEDREALTAQFSTETQKPLGFAMAAMNYGKPGEGVFLGAFLMDLALSRHAAEDVRWLHQRGAEVTLTNLPQMTLARFSGLLDCPTQPIGDASLTLTTNPDKATEPATLVVTPGATIMQAVKGLSRLRMRLRRQPYLMAMTITTLFICCFICGLPALELGLMHIVLCIASVLPILWPSEKSMPRFRHALVSHGLTMALVLAVFALGSLFIRSMTGVQTGACVLFLLPVLLMLMVRDMQQSVGLYTRLSIALAALLTVLLGVMTCISFAIEPIAAAFMVIAGTLCAIGAAFMPSLFRL